MKIDRVLELLKIERECVTRQSPCNEKSKLCDRNCGECDIAQNDLELIEMYDFVISMIETLIGRSQWISVKDRLPERKEYLHESNVIRGSSEYVLVYISATFPYKRMFVTIGRYSYDEMYPRWIVRSSHDGDVTHWMPLPEPPEVKQE